MSNELKLVNPQLQFLPMNIRYSASLKLPFLAKNELADCRGVVVCGTAPTLLEPKTIREIKRLANMGYKIFAVKQAIRLLTNEGITVSYSFAMDPGEKQIRKTPLQKGVTYILASSCHPAMFDYLLGAGMDVRIFHSACGASENGMHEMQVYANYFPDHCAPEHVACGGYTVVNRAVAASEYMGAKRIFIAGAPFGWRESASYYAEGIKEPAGNATGPTLYDQRQVDGYGWYSKADLMPSAVAIAQKAKATPHKIQFIGDSLAASLAKHTEHNIEGLKNLMISQAVPARTATPVSRSLPVGDLVNVH